MAEHEEHEYLTLKQAADLLQVSERTLWELCKKEQFPHFKVGNQYRLRREAIDEWVRRTEKGSGDP